MPWEVSGQLPQQGITADTLAKSVVQNNEVFAACLVQMKSCCNPEKSNNVTNLEAYCTQQPGPIDQCISVSMCF